MHSHASDPVVITGMGVVTPTGCSLDELWDGLCAGESMAAPITRFDVDRHRVQFACTVRGLEDCNYLTDKEARRLDPFAQYAVTAAMAAYEDAGSPTPDPIRAAILSGNIVGGRMTSDTEARNYVEKGPGKVHPLMPLQTMPNTAPALIAIRLGWRGPAMAISTACASGTDAIGQAVLMLRDHRADMVLAGGCEAAVTPVALAGFTNLNAVSSRNDDPKRASRPFDADRDGFVLGEGAGYVVLERRADAEARGATPYAAVTGYAATADAFHLAMPPEDGAGAVECMSAALADAGLDPSDIAHVNAHGTSTPYNDRAEASALEKVFGPSGPPVTSTKGAIGHLIGAAGAVELIATVLALRHGVVPPTANHERTDPDMKIDVVHGAPRSVRPGPALSNSFGFGGHNACLVVEPL
ncbi:MAG TPA: beta-ketoacyl-[acyl-carrier-protein] synthase family protein [Acidimicrobiales bacterium]|jgi:3-oxoacyl-[acyl-carrier-protein] synthase II